MRWFASGQSDVLALSFDELLVGPSILDRLACYAREEPRLSTGWINVKNHNYFAIANYISRIY